MCHYFQLSSTEEMKKRLVSELECQRHNAEAARASLEQKLKDTEKAHKAELSSHTDTVRDMEKHLEESKNKMQLDLKKVRV